MGKITNLLGNLEAEPKNYGKYQRKLIFYLERGE